MYRTLLLMQGTVFSRIFCVFMPVLSGMVNFHEFVRRITPYVLIMSGTYHGAFCRL